MRSCSRSGRFAVVILGSGLLALAACSPVKPPLRTAEFGCSTTDQFWTVPPGVTRITLDVYGAEGSDGGTAGANAGGEAGNGGRVIAGITVTPGQTLRVFPGCQAGWPTGAGYVGGGDPGAGNGAGAAGGGGGSYSVVHTTADPIVFLVWAGGGGGGGGAGMTGPGFAGGNGGHPTGAPGPPCGSPIQSGCGGTQTEPGIGCGGPCNAPGVGGGDAQAGGTVNNGGGGGGGGGLRGGGGGGASGASGSGGHGGGGGSSFGPADATFENGVREGDGLVVIYFYA